MIKVFGVPWHVSHQYDLFTALDGFAEFYLCENNVRRWSENIRPLPKNVHFVKYYEPGKYDLALLHIDQQCSHPKLGKSTLYNDLNEVITDIPKIVIMHGTPMIPEYGYDEDVVINGGIIYKDGKPIKIEGIKNQVGDNFMVVNSHKAAERWGWGYTIWHGKNPKDYWDLPKEPRVVTMISAGGMDKYYNRSYLSLVREYLEEYGIRLWQITVDWTMDSDTEFEGFDAYRNFLGRSLIYLNLTLDAPMPRARVEAMLSGCTIITTNNHDEDMFIENGKNGFLIPNDTPKAVGEMILKFLGEKEDNFYPELIKIGQEGKKTAIKTFTMEKYREEWIKVINLVLKKGSKEAGKELYEQERKKEKC